MKIITKHPIIYKSSSVDGDYSGLDGKSSSKQILFFQKWVNQFRGEKLKLDGKWGSKTQTAWNKYGKDFENAAMGANTLINNALTTSGGGATPSEANAGKPNAKGVAFLNKLKSGFNKAKDSGLIDKLKDRAGLDSNGATATGNVGGAEYTSGPSEEKKSMPKALKIGLIVAIPLALIGLYLVTRKKK